MLILTEKPSVAKDFANALGCRSYAGYYVNDNCVITNCIGHLYQLQQPDYYDPKYKSWSELPCIPERFSYAVNPATARQERLVNEILEKHKSDKIIIATDADREGEIIARECLRLAGIKDYSNIYRFWVSEALTKDVILQGLKTVQPLENYNKLAMQGFSRQHCDWLVGINFTRYITVAANTKLPAGRVQTAILEAIYERNHTIENFKPEPYYEFLGSFSDGTHILTAKYHQNDITKFNDGSLLPDLKKNEGQHAQLKDHKVEAKTENPPQLYNLNSLQKDAFKRLNLSAEDTLAIVQKLYEVYKCCSYPRTPSKVMGTSNVDLCTDIYQNLVSNYPQYNDYLATADTTVTNKHIYNNAKLEAHHALIPLSALPQEATKFERDVYNLLLDRFMLAFQPLCNYEKHTIVFDVNNHTYQTSGKKIINPGWKKFLHGSSATWRSKDDDEETEDSVVIPDLNWNSLYLEKVESVLKHTKPPKYYNEASIIAFMENPTNKEGDKLIGLGTQSTRHTFIPKLTKCRYITTDSKKHLLVTNLGKSFLDSIKKTTLKDITSVEQTTKWEECLSEDPAGFERSIREYVYQSCTIQQITGLSLEDTNAPKCPKCGLAIRKGKSNWYCTGYKNGCDFKLWINCFGTTLTDSDVDNICQLKNTRIKNCIAKNGNRYTCKLKLDDNFVLQPIFSK